MKHILFINACVRPESRTLILAKQILCSLEGTIEEVNLEQAGIMPLNRETLQERDAHIQKKEFQAPMLQYANQFANADEIVIAAPYWDLSFPSTLRIYFEAVSVCELSFHYTPDGCAKGLCNAKRITYVTTAGGSIAEYNLGYDYIKALAHTFYGIPEVRCYKAENLDMAGVDVNEIMQKTIDEITRDGALGDSQ